MKEMLLLGAGASVDAGVPSARDMGRAILSALRSNPQTREQGRALSLVAGGLAFQEGVRGGDPHAAADVEGLFNAVRMLADRDCLDITPFVGSWHSAVNELDRDAAEAALRRLHETLHRGSAGALGQAIAPAHGPVVGRPGTHEIDRAVAAAVRGGSSTGFDSVGRAVDAFVTQALAAVARKLGYDGREGEAFSKEMLRILRGVQPGGGGGRIFADTAEAMIAALKDLVWVTDPERVVHLAPLATRARARRRLVVASLNYDNCVELMATREVTASSC